ncbi:ABC transporter ATP-binding protein [Brachybacterium paraconglomeratum]|uniref:ABC transporter ATP-binding protein n=1 Tax=Brachybacterium paraconglomeratum TaxID=173362 RepID=UPI003FD49D17
MTVQDTGAHEASDGAEATPVLEARDVVVTFEGKGIDGAPTMVTACDRVSLRLAPGEIVALVGESGSGKTTFARTMGLFQDIDSGQVLLEGQPIQGDGRRRLRPREFYGEVQMIFQDPFASLNHLKTIRHIIGRAVRLHSGLRSRRPVEERTLELLETVHLTPAEDYIDRYPSALSGGQRQRISIARALAVNPSVILADEPTSMLDVSIRVDVLNLLAELRRERGVAILYITHDIASARYLSDRMAVMYRGRMVELGETEQVVLEPAHEYTRTLIKAAPDPRRRKRRRRRGDETSPFTT